jgi:hypothetical protein
LTASILAPVETSPGEEEDRILSQTLAANSARMRKRRMGLHLSSDVQVPLKYRKIGTKFNLSQFLEDYEVPIVL